MLCTAGQDGRGGIKELQRGNGGGPERAKGKTGEPEREAATEAYPGKSRRACRECSGSHVLCVSNVSRMNPAGKGLLAPVAGQLGRQQLPGSACVVDDGSSGQLFRRVVEG
eukprot:1929719-Rhodomonas_salina.3